MALNPRQEVFVAAYLANPNASDAARKAGYAHPGSAGNRLLKNVEISARVGLKVAEVAMGPDEVLRLTATMARLYPFATSDARAAMQGKMKALELIGKYHKLWTDKVEHTGPGGGPIQVRAVDLSELTVEELRDLQRIATRFIGPGDDQPGAEPQVAP